MKAELINELLILFENACYDFHGIECWSARELQVILGYSQWRNFVNAIEKAKITCESSGNLVSDHFADVSKMVELGSNTRREIDDFALSRYGCYLVAQNGDNSKNEIAFAQTYFAVQTRKQEIIELRLQDIARIKAREKLSKAEKKLSGIIYERGVDDKGFAYIRSQGDNALFGGFNTQEMKKKLKIADARPLADFLPILTIKAKDFATELTSHNVVEKNLFGQNPISNEHIENNRAVRKILKERGVQPEKLPVNEDVKKVLRRVEKENSNISKTSKKLK